MFSAAVQFCKGRDTNTLLWLWTFAQPLGPMRNWQTKLQWNCTLWCVFQRCDVCAKPGATVGCCHNGCMSNYHFMCARKNRCAFQDNKKVFCQLHFNSVDTEVGLLASWLGIVLVCCVVSVNHGLWFLASLSRWLSGLDHWIGYSACWPDGLRPLAAVGSNPGLEGSFSARLSTVVAHTLLNIAHTVSSVAKIWLMPQSPHCLQNDLKCVEWGVKPCSNQSNLSWYLGGIVDGNMAGEFLVGRNVPGVSLGGILLGLIF